LGAQTRQISKACNNPDCLHFVSFFQKKKKGGYAPPLINLLAANPPLCTADEADQVFHLRACLQFLIHHLNRLGNIEVTAVEDLESSLQLQANFRGDPIATQAHNIDAMHCGGIAFHQHERWNILYQFGMGADHSHPAHFGELMNANQAPNYSLIFDYNVTCDGCSMRDHNVVSDDAIMGQVGCSHDEIIVTHPSLAASPLCSGADSCILSNHIPIADNEISFLSLKFKILRTATYYGTGEDLVVAPELHPAFYHHMGTDFRAISDLNVWTDYSVWSDLYV
jgi:hypothetical protein